MALIKCPHCGKEISDKAKKCVGCGWEVNLEILNTDEVFTNFGETILDNTETKKDMIALEKKSLEKSQKELEQIKKKENPRSQQEVYAEKKTKISNVSMFLFMLITSLVMICFVVIVWKKLDKFATELDMMVSNKQIESEMLMNDMENGIEKNLADNEKEETSDRNSQNENVTDENGQSEEIEEASGNVENDVPSEKNVANANNLKFEYTGNNVSDAYVTIYFKIENEGEVPIHLTIQKFHFLNEVSIEQAFAKLDDEIPSGKSSLLEICFNREKIEAAEISTIDSFVCQYDIAEDVDSDNLTPNEITFNGLGIDIN